MRTERPQESTGTRIPQDHLAAEAGRDGARSTGDETTVGRERKGKEPTVFLRRLEQDVRRWGDGTDEDEESDEASRSPEGF